MDERSQLLPGGGGGGKKKAKTHREVEEEDQSVELALAKMTRLTAELAELSRGIGGPPDGPGLRRELRRLRESLAAESRHCLGLIKGGAKGKGRENTSSSQNRQLAQFRREFAQCQAVSTQSIERERTAPNFLRRNSHPEEVGNPQIVPETRGSPDSTANAEGPSQKQLRGEFRENKDEAASAIIAERNAHMRQIERELGALRDVFEEVSGMVAEQGEDLVFVQDHVADARKDVETGTQNLRKASTYRHTSRARTLALVICVVIVFGGLLAFLLFFFKPGSLGGAGAVKGA